MMAIIAFVQAHAQLFASFASAIVAFLVGIHPSFQTSSLIQFIQKLLGQVPTPPAAG